MAGGTIKYTLVLQAGQFESAAKSAADAMKTSGVAIAGAAVAIGAALAKATSDALNLGGKLADLQAKSGIGAEGLQRLEASGRLTGNTLEQMTGAVARMQRALVETPEKFNAVGLSASKLIQMQPDQAFAKIGEQIGKIHDPAQRSAAAMSLFGKAGADMLPVLTSAMGKAGAEAERLGQVLSQDAVNALDATGDQIDVLGATLSGLWNQLGAGIGQSEALARAIAGVTEILGSLSRAVAGNQDALATWASMGAATAVTAMAKLVEAAGIAKTWLDNLSIAANQLTEKKLRIQLAMEVGDRPEFVAKRAALEQQIAAVVAERSAAIQGADKDLQTLMALAQKLEDLAAHVQQAGSASRAATPETEAFGKALVYVGEKAREAAEKLSIYQYNANNLELPEGGIKRTKFVDVLQDIPEMKGGRDIGSMMLGPQVGQQLGGALRDALAGAMKGLPQVMAAALQGGGDVGKSVGAHLGGALGEGLKAPITKGLSSVLGKGLGSALGSAVPGLGTALGAIGGELAGKLFGKLFGGGQERAEANKLRERFTAAFGGMENLRAEADKLGVSIDRAFSSNKPKEVQAVMDAMAAAVKKNEERIKGLDTAISAVGGAFGRSAPGKDGEKGAFQGGIIANTEKDAESQALIFGAVFSRALKEKGMVGAADALRDTFAGLKDSLGSLGGESVEALLGPISRIMELTKPGGDGEGAGLFRGAAEGASALAQVLSGLTKDDVPLLGSQFAAFGQQAQSAFAQAMAGGATSGEALQAIGPLLQSIISASGQYGIEIDANTQALIDQARASGVAFKSDPQDRLRQSIDALTTALGGVPPKFDEIGESAVRASSTTTSATSATAQAVGAAVSATVEGFTGVNERAAESIVTVAGQTSNSLAAMGGDIEAEMKAAAGAVTDTWGSATGEMALQSLEAGLQIAAEWGITEAILTKSFEETLPESVQAYIEKLGEIPTRILTEAVFTGSSNSNSNSNSFAGGGIAEGPSTGFNARLHGREAIIPLDRPSAIGAALFGGSDLEPLLGELRSLNHKLDRMPRAFRDAVLLAP